MGNKIYRKDKIELLGNIYFGMFQVGEGEVRIVNQIIIDSIGVSGLEKVKKIAWKKIGRTYKVWKWNKNG